MVIVKTEERGVKNSAWGWTKRVVLEIEAKIFLGHLWQVALKAKTRGSYMVQGEEV